MQKSALLRQLQIDMISDDPNPITIWFGELWNSLSKMEINVFQDNGNETIYFLDNETWPWVFYHDKTNGQLVCNYDHYWSRFANNKTIKSADIKPITEFLVQEALNGEVVWAIGDSFISFDPIQDALNGNMLEWNDKKYEKT